MFNSLRHLPLAGCVVVSLLACIAQHALADLEFTDARIIAHVGDSITTSGYEVDPDPENPKIRRFVADGGPGLLTFGRCCPAGSGIQVSVYQDMRGQAGVAARAVAPSFDFTYGGNASRQVFIGNTGASDVEVQVSVYLPGGALSVDGLSGLSKVSRASLGAFVEVKNNAANVDAIGEILWRWDLSLESGNPPPVDPMDPIYPRYQVTNEDSDVTVSEYCGQLSAGILQAGSSMTIELVISAGAHRGSPSDDTFAAAVIGEPEALNSGNPGATFAAHDITGLTSGPAALGLGGGCSASGPSPANAARVMPALRILLLPSNVPGDEE